MAIRRCLNLLGDVDGGTKSKQSCEGAASPKGGVDSRMILLVTQTTSDFEDAPFPVRQVFIWPFLELRP
jgi:hypothetical protein